MRLEDRTVPATIVWDGGPTGQGTNWLDPVNWAGDVLPGPTDDAVIGPAAPGQSLEITLTGAATVQSATVTGRTLSLLNATFTGSLVNHGTIRSSSATVNAPLANDGTITVAGDTTWNSPGDSANSGTVDVTGGNLTLNQPAGAAFTTTGTVTVASFRTFAVNGGEYHQAAGTTRLLANSTVNAGSLSQSGGTIALFGYGSLIVNGTFSQTGGLLDVRGDQFYATLPVRIHFGGVALGGSLAVSLARGGVGLNQEYRIIDNVGPDPVSGTFAGLPEGARLMAGSPTLPLPPRVKISYAGGTNNDVVLTDDDGPATLVWDGGPTGQGTNWLVPFNWSENVLPRFNDDVVIGPLAGGPTVVTLTTGIESVGVHNLTVTGGTLRLDEAMLGAGNVTNSGTIELTGMTTGARYTSLASGLITNAPGGTISLLGGSSRGRFLAGSIDNQGTISIAATAFWYNNGASTNAGTIDVTAGNFLTLAPNFSGASFTNTGAVRVAAGGTFTVTDNPYTQAGGTTTVAGTMTVNAAFTQSGGTTTVAGTLTVNGAFGQSGGTAAIVLNGPIPGSQYGQIKVNGSVNIGGATLSAILGPGFNPPLGTTFTILDNDGTDAVLGTFAGLSEGATVAANGQSFTISYLGGTGNDIVLSRTATPPVSSVVVNAGQANLVQRSLVTNVTVTFTRLVSFVGPAADAFQLARTGPGAIGNVTLAVDLSGSTATQTIARLTFSGALTEGANSLVDGNYTLTVFSNQIQGGVQGGDNASTLFRLFGDVNGDRAVNGLDLTAFRSAFGANSTDGNYLAAFDWNGDGVINGTDLTQFRNRFGAILP